MKTQQGFTLIELLVTMIIGALILGMAVPSYQSFTRSSLRSANLNEFVSALQFARSEAIKRGSRVTLCQSTTGVSCDGGPEWENGWIVFNDDDDNNTVNNVESVLRVNPGSSGLQTTLRANDVSITAQSLVSFLPTGFPQRTNRAAQSGVFTLCDADGDAQARGIALSASGRVRVTQNPAQLGAC